PYRGAPTDTVTLSYAGGPVPHQTGKLGSKHPDPRAISRASQSQIPENLPRASFGTKGRVCSSVTRVTGNPSESPRERARERVGVIAADDFAAIGHAWTS